MTTVHVIGAGVSGLSCALRLAQAGRPVVVHEAAGHAGGRCRSFVDKELGCLIDNGSHMLLGANTATKALLTDIGTLDDLTEVSPAAFPFYDAGTGESWRLRPNAGPIPIWPWLRDRRVPGSHPWHYLSLLRLARARENQTVADCVGTGPPLYENFWQPISRAVLNTDASEGSARLLWAMLSETFFKGEVACRPLYFGKGLSPTLIDPAVAEIERLGGTVRFTSRLRNVEFGDGRASALRFGDVSVELAGEQVVLAVSADVCADLVRITAPTEFRAIINVHFKLDKPPQLPWGLPFLGTVGTEAQWLFARDDILSVTISAGDTYAETPVADIAGILWKEASVVLGDAGATMPPYRVIKEKRATIAQTPSQDRLRPAARTEFANLFLAGDWTDTGLPATIEGSVRSGEAAARALLETH